MNDELIQQQAFDFLSIDDPATRTRVIERDVRFDFTKQQVEGGLIKMGRILIEQKADLQHGKWTEWLLFKGVAHSTAKTLMQISEKFSKGPHGGFLGFKVLQLLSQDSTPESARTEAIEKTENGESLTIKQTKELVEAHKRNDVLRKELDLAKAQIPTDDIKSMIAALEARLEYEMNKPPVVETVIVEKVPDDYRGLISERDTLVDEKDRLLRTIKRLKDSQGEEVEKQVNQKLKALEEDFNLKNRQLKAIQDRIDYLRESMKLMDKTAGDHAACKKACDQIRGFLLDISVALRDLLEDHKLTKSTEKEMRHLCGELEQGAAAFRKYLDGEKLIEIGG
jgi:hypothetical protein